MERRFCCLDSGRLTPIPRCSKSVLNGSARQARRATYTHPMPLYEYECSACGALFERLRSMSDDAPGCPNCESEHVMRRISMF
ncbi:MAG: FmdB family zinc ribbon protein, partial [Mycobacterium sp.]